MQGLNLRLGALSSDTTGGVVNNQEVITYTVYNESADPLTGVLLTDTLQSGVTFQSASQLPDQSGQNLAWSMGTIAGFDRKTLAQRRLRTGQLFTEKPS